MKRIKPISEYSQLASLECAIKCAGNIKLGKSIFFSEKVRKEFRFWKFKEKCVVHLENGQYVYVDGEKNEYYSFFSIDNIKVSMYYKIKENK